ncbi:MAG: DNA polymerase III subunit chi [Alphaproteobacteria bacterium]|nr:DNA polymerase III subunit chi [Alphaproteobacteria bacterium]
MEIRFYHLTRRPLEFALPEILGKALGRGHRVVVRALDEKDVEYLNEKLWTADPASFLPHGSARDGNGEAQPVWLTAGEDNPNGADVLIVTGLASDAGMDAYALCLHMFDGNSEDAVREARDRWKAYKAAGHDMTYWQQLERGWEKKS